LDFVTLDSEIFIKKISDLYLLMSPEQTVVTRNLHLLQQKKRQRKIMEESVCGKGGGSSGGGAEAPRQGKRSADAVGRDGAKEKHHRGDQSAARGRKGRAREEDTADGDGAGSEVKGSNAASSPEDTGSSTNIVIKEEGGDTGSTEVRCSWMTRGAAAVFWSSSRWSRRIPGAAAARWRRSRRRATREAATI
jgi:hypothetical protein